MKRDGKLNNGRVQTKVPESEVWSEKPLTSRVQNGKK